MKVSVKIKKLHPEAIIPNYAHEGDAGLDIYTIEEYNLKPGERHLFKTGLAIQIPEGYVSLFGDKSGLALNSGLTTLGGVIEHTYRGEYQVILLNISDKEIFIKKHQKIAQLLIQPICTAEIQEVDKLSETKRGSGGFGSTGV